MVSLVSRCTDSAICSAELLRRFRGLVFGLALAVSPLLGHAQGLRSVQPLGGSNGIGGGAVCSSDWTNRMAVPIKVTDSLIVSVPVKYIRYELLTCGTATNDVARDGPTGTVSLSFDFFLPDFSGFTYKRLREPFDVNEVHIGSVVSEREVGFGPKRPAPEPSQELENFINAHEADPKKYRDMYGLRCYEGKVLKDRIFCFSARGGQGSGGIFLIVEVPPYARGVVDPLMRADYFSRRYGGIEVDWWSNVKNLPHWRDIDTKIWTRLAAWNVAHSTKNNP
jgi:hypothetical protein